MNTPSRRLIPTLAASFLYFLALACVPSLRAQPSPVLGVSYSAGQITLKWQDTNDWLQTAATLFPGAPWVNLSNAPVMAGDANSITMPATNLTQFFRLIHSPNLPPPTGLVLQAEQDSTGDNWFALWWDGVPQASSYNLYYAADPGVTQFNYSTLSEGAILTGITNTFATVANLIVGHKYYFVVTAVSASGESTDSGKAWGVFGPFATMSGTVYTLLPDGTNLVREPVQGATVTISELAQPLLSSQAVSDSDGTYILADQPSGSYTLCWSAPGFVSGCYPDTVLLTNADVDIDLVVTNDGSGLLYGTVSLADGSLAAQADPFFGIQANVAVSLGVTNSHPLRTVAVNAASDYVMANLAVQSGLTLSAGNGMLSAATNVSVSGIQRIDLVLPNTPPEVLSLTAFSNGAPVISAPPGTTLQVIVVATNGTGGLHYQWFPGPETTNFTTVDSPIVGWTLPATRGLQSMYVLVTDGFGGCATAHLEVSTETGLLFTGQVVDANGIPIAGAYVTVNAGVFTNSDADGDFSLLVTNTDPYYTLQATSPGYVPFAAAYSTEAQGVECVLLPEPPCNIDLDTTAGIAGYTPDCFFLIASNSLARLAGGAPQNPFCLTITNLDPCDVASELGLTTTASQNGTNLGLTFLAVYDMRAMDSSGASLDLTQAMSMSLAASTNCLNLLSNQSISSAAFWHYDETNAVWQPAGDAVAAVFGAGRTGFAVQPPRLGLNAVAVPGNPNARILNFRFDKTLSLPLISRFVNQAGKRTGDEKLVTLQAFPGRVAAIFVPSDAVAIQVLSPKEAPEIYPPITDNAKKTVIVQVTIPPPAVLPNNGNLTVGLVSQIPNLTEARVKGANMFLTAKFGAGSSSVAQAYYNVIDPAGAKTTLKAFLEANGFTANGVPQGDTATAYFFNACDLGFGRDMHLKRTATVKGPKGDGDDNVAFYVSNYKSVADAKAGRGLIATVCMDYVYNPDPAVQTKRLTTFYVYDGKGDRVGAADLDGNGDKFVPNLCMVCHGGSQKSIEKLTELVDDNIKNRVANIAANLKGQEGDLGSHFIPFDPNSYTYGQKDGPLSEANQLAAFGKLNQAVQAAAPLPATAQLLQAWAGGGFDAVPAGWANVPPNNNIQPAYSGAVAISCRSCHVMRTGAKAFADFTDFSSKKTKINDQVYAIPADEVMPNALRTFTIFWGSKAANSASIKPAAVPPPDQAELIKTLLGLQSSDPTPAP